jgi:hypothetical protein
VRQMAAWCLAVVTVGGAANAQWLNYIPPDVPRTADGKPNLLAPSPRTAEGKPDLSGVWMHEKTSADEMRRLFGPRDRGGDSNESTGDGDRHSAQILT